MEFGSLPLLLVICILLLSCWEAACSDRNGLLNGLEQDEPWLHGTRHTLREITPTWSRRLKDEIHDLDAAEAEDELSEYVFWVLERNRSLDLPNSAGSIPLQLAAAAGLTNMTRTLLELDVDPNVKEPNSGWTAMMFASERGHLGVVKELLAVKADVEYKANSTGVSALYLAAGSGHAELISELIDAGSDPNSFTASNATPLLIAVVGGHVAAVDVLLKNGADAAASDQDGNTPILRSVQRTEVNSTNQERIVELLLDAGADPNSSNSGGQTLLWIASFNADPRVVELLLEKDADVDKKANDGTSPVFLAAGKCTECLGALLRKNANPNAVYPKGNWTPLHYAAGIANLESVRMLLDAGASREAQAANGAYPVDVIGSIEHNKSPEEERKIRDLLTQPARENEPMQEPVPEPSPEVVVKAVPQLGTGLVPVQEPKSEGGDDAGPVEDADEEPKEEPADAEPKEEPADAEPKEEPVDAEPKEEPADAGRGGTVVRGSEPQQEPIDVSGKDPKSEIEKQSEAGVLPEQESDPKSDRGPTPSTAQGQGLESATEFIEVVSVDISSSERVEDLDPIPGTPKNTKKAGFPLWAIILLVLLGVSICCCGVCAFACSRKNQWERNQPIGMVSDSESSTSLGGPGNHYPPRDGNFANPAYGTGYIDVR